MHGNSSGFGVMGHAGGAVLASLWLLLYVPQIHSKLLQQIDQEIRRRTVYLCVSSHSLPANEACQECGYCVLIGGLDYYFVLFFKTNN